MQMPVNSHLLRRNLHLWCSHVHHLYMFNARQLKMKAWTKRSSFIICFTDKSAYFWWYLSLVFQAWIWLLSHTLLQPTTDFKHFINSYQKDWRPWNKPAKRKEMWQLWQSKRLLPGTVPWTLNDHLSDILAKKIMKQIFFLSLQLHK